MEFVESKRLTELKILMDSLVLTYQSTYDPSRPERAVVDEAVQNFLNAGAELLNEATPYLWEYYRFIADASFDEHSHALYGTPLLEPQADIWTEVTFSGSPTIRIGGRPLEPGTSYISFEGEVTWEHEHGLQLVFEHGQRVCKVGPYDGHNTNAHAYADPSLLGVIYV